MTLNERIVDLCLKNNISQSKMERDLKIAKGSVTKWKTQEPRYTTLEDVAKYFHVSVEYLMTGEEKEGGEKYYINDETANIAQKIFENKELRLLFDAAKDSSKEDIETVHSMLLALKRKENNCDE